MYLCYGNEAKLKPYKMITRDNLKYFIESIPAETMQSELAKPNDFVLLEAHIFNVGGYATIESLDYDEDVDEDAQASGNLFCDKDTFLQLCEDLEVFEY